MKKLIPPIAVLIAVTTFGTSAASASNDEPTTKRAADPLFDTISALDAAVFDAFNSCSSPGQLQKHASYFAPDVEQGSHRFCQFASGKCEGIADFVIVWSNQNGSWQITRVLSYGHRPNK